MSSACITTKVHKNAHGWVCDQKSEVILMFVGAGELAPPLGGSDKVALTVYRRAGALRHRPMMGKH